MATAFNLTAQLNIVGPNNLKPVISSIRKQISGLNANVNLKISGRSNQNIQKLTNSVNALNAALTQTSSLSQQVSANLNTASAAFQNMQGSLNNVVNNLNNVNKASKNTAKSISTASSAMEKFGNQAGLAIKRFAAYASVTTVVYGLTRAFSNAFEEYMKFDKATVTLTQVTGKTAEGLSGLTKEITRLSTAFGVSSNELINVSTTLAQAGLSANDTTTALQALAKASLAPSFDDLSETVEGSIAAMRQFGISAGELEGALGSINAVAAAFAVESSDIITAIQRTGGVFATASKGVSTGTEALNEFISIFTSVRATTRESAETIATGLRTIFTRIQRGSTIEYLRGLGIELTDIEGKFIGPYQAIERLSGALRQLDPRDLRFSQIVEELGGFRQIGKVIPLIQQFATTQEALKVAQRGQDSLTKNAVQAQLSLANQLAKVREEFLALIRSIGDDKAFRTIISLALNLTSALISVAGAFKPILPYLAVLGAVKATKGALDFGKGFVGAFTKGGGASAAGTAAGSAITGGGSSARGQNTQANTTALLANTSQIQALTTAISPLTTSINTLDQTLNTWAAVFRTLLNGGGGGTTGAPGTFSDGGPIRKFARGGMVPGSGNGDTVPAMLEPGEFVIRKKAVQTIGADRLHKMNKYAEGGEVYATNKPFGMLVASEENPENRKKGEIRYTDKQTKDQYTAPIVISGFSRTKEFKKTQKKLPKVVDNIVDDLNSSLKTNMAQSFVDKAKNLTSTAAGTLFEGFVLTSANMSDPGNINFDIPKTNNKIQGLTDEPVQDLTDIKLSNTKANQESIIKKAVNEAPQLFRRSSTLERRGPGRPRTGEEDIYKYDTEYAAGGLVQKYMAGGVAEDYIRRIENIGGIPGATGLLSRAGELPQGRLLNNIFRKDSIKSGKNFENVEKYLKLAEDQQRIEKGALVEKIASSNTFGLVGLLPIGHSATELTKIGGMDTVIEERGLSDDYLDVILNLQEKIKAQAQATAQEAQMAGIFGRPGAFGPRRRLVFDFDETLVNSDESIFLGPDGRIDTSLFSNLDLVREGLKTSVLTPLGEELKARSEQGLVDLNNIRVLTARPQSNAPLIGETLRGLGLNIPDSQIMGVSGAENKINNLSEFEMLVDDRLATIEQIRQAGRTGIGYRPIQELSDTTLNRMGRGNVEGAYAEQIMAMLGAPVGDNFSATRPIDYPNGLGLAAQYFGIDPNIPTEVKREINPDLRYQAKGEIARYYKEVMRFANGGVANRRFRSLKEMEAEEGTDINKYKGILRSILPKEMITPDGLLKTPDGTGEPIKIIGRNKPQSIASYIIGMFKKQNLDKPSITNEGAYYLGSGIFRAFKSNIEKFKDKMDPLDYSYLSKEIDGMIARAGKNDEISLQGSRTKGTLAHETFHDVQGYLYEYYPEIMDKLFAAQNENQKAITDWYNNPEKAKYFKGYALETLFPNIKTLDQYQIAGGTSGLLLNRLMESKKRKGVESTPSTGALAALTSGNMDVGRMEAIPILMSAASEGDSDAQNILGTIFETAGLNKNFYRTLPKFAKGGSAEDTVPALLTPGEFVINKKAAQKIGYSQLNRLNKADKLQGYNKGGYVDHVQKFAAGGTPELPNVSAYEDIPGLGLQNITPTFLNRILNKITGGINIPKISNLSIDQISESFARIVVNTRTLYKAIEDYRDALDTSGISQDRVKEIIDTTYVAYNELGAKLERQGIESAKITDILNGYASAVDKETAQIIARTSATAAVTPPPVPPSAPTPTLPTTTVNPFASITGTMGAAAGGGADNKPSAFAKAMSSILGSTGVASKDLVDKFTQTADKLGGVTSSIGLFSIVLSTQLPKIANVLDNFTGSNFASSPGFAALGGGLRQGGANLFVGAQLASAAGLDKTSVGGVSGTTIIAALSGITGAIEGAFEEYSQKQVEALDRFLKASDQKFATLINKINAPGVRAQDQIDLFNQALKESSNRLSQLGEISGQTKETVTSTIGEIFTTLKDTLFNILLITSLGKSKGGVVYASGGKLINFESKGTDTVPAMLTPGEFVVNRQATQKNLPLLEAINKSRGGVVYMARGGRNPTSYNPGKDYTMGGAFGGYLTTLNETYNPFAPINEEADALSETIKNTSRAFMAVGVASGVAAGGIALLGPAAETATAGTTALGTSSTTAAASTTTLGTSAAAAANPFASMTGTMGVAAGGTGIGATGLLSSITGLFSSGGALVTGLTGAITKVFGGLTFLQKAGTFLAAGGGLFTLLTRFFSNDTSKLQKETLDKIASEIKNTNELSKVLIERMSTSDIKEVLNIAGAYRAGSIERGAIFGGERSANVRVREMQTLQAQGYNPQDIEKIKADIREAQLTLANTPNAVTDQQRKLLKLEENLANARNELYKSVFIQSSAADEAEKNRLINVLDGKEQEARAAYEAKRSGQQLSGSQLKLADAYEKVIVFAQSTIGAQEEIAIQQENMNRAMREGAAIARNFYEAIDTMSRGLNRAAAEFRDAAEQMSFEAGLAAGNVGIAPTDNAAINMLNNPAAYTVEEIRKISDQLNAQLGIDTIETGKRITPQGQIETTFLGKELTDNAVAIRQLTVDLPDLLARGQSLGEDRGTLVKDAIKLMEGAGIDKESAQIFGNELQKKLNELGTSREQVNYNELLQNIPGFTGQLEYQQRTLDLQKDFANKLSEVNKKVVQVAKEIADSLAQEAEYRSQYIEALNSGNFALREAIGDIPSLTERLNAITEARTEATTIRSPQGDIAVRGGSTVDELVTIIKDGSEKIRQAQKDLNDPTTREQGRQSLTRYTASVSVAQKALKDLASSSQAAQLALAKFRELEQIQQNRTMTAFDLLIAAQTGDFDAIAKMTRSAMLQDKLLTGNLRPEDLNEPGALEALKNLPNLVDQLRGVEAGNEIRDKIAEAFTKGAIGQSLLVASKGMLKPEDLARIFARAQDTPEGKNALEEARKAEAERQAAAKEVAAFQLQAAAVLDERIVSSSQTFYDNIVRASEVAAQKLFLENQNRIFSGNNVPNAVAQTFISPENIGELIKQDAGDLQFEAIRSLFRDNKLDLFNPETNTISDTLTDLINKQIIYSTESNKDLAKANAQEIIQALKNNEFQINYRSLEKAFENQDIKLNQDQIRILTEGNGIKLDTSKLSDLVDKGIIVNLSPEAKEFLDLYKKFKEGRVNAQPAAQAPPAGAPIGGGGGAVFARGGIVYASAGEMVDFQPKGTDTIPAMLTPGEFVVNRKATQKNLGLLKNINNGVIYRADGSTEPEGMRRSETGNIRWYESIGLSPNTQAKDNNVGPFSSAQSTNYRNLAYGWGSDIINPDLFVDSAKNYKPALQEASRSISQRLKDKKSIDNQNIEDINTTNFDKPIGSLPSIATDMEKAVGYKYMQQIGQAPDPFNRKENKLGTAYSAYDPRSIAESLITQQDKWIATGSGVASKIIPAFLSTVAGGIGLVAGSFAGSPLAGLGLSIALASIANTAGENINDLIYDLAIAPNFPDIEKSIKENPGSYSAGQWVGLASELAVGAKFAPVLEQSMRREFAGAILSLTDQPIMQGSKVVGYQPPTGGFAQFARNRAIETAITPEEMEKATELVYKEIAKRSEEASSGIKLKPVFSATGAVQKGKDWVEEAAKSKVLSEFTVTRGARGYSKALTTEEATELLKQFPANAGNANSLASLVERTKAGESTILSGTDLYRVGRGNIGPGAYFDNYLPAIKEYMATRLLEGGDTRLLVGLAPEQVLKDFIEPFSNNPKFNELISEWANSQGYKTVVNATEMKTADLLNSIQEGIISSKNVTADSASAILQDKIKNIAEQLKVGGFRTSTANIFSPELATASQSAGNTMTIIQGEFFKKNGGDIFGMKMSDLFKPAMESWKQILTKELGEGAVESTFSANDMESLGPKPNIARRFQSGGLVYANQGMFVPRGTDTVPAMLTPGEFVVNRDATRKNIGLLQSINNGYMSKGGKVGYYQAGGEVSGGLTPMGIDLTIFTRSVDKFSASVDNFGNIDFGVFTQGVNRLASSVSALNGPVNTFNQAAVSFGENLSQISSIINALSNIPSIITVNGRIDMPTNIVITLEGETANITPQFRKEILTSVADAISTDNPGISTNTLRSFANR